MQSFSGSVAYVHAFGREHQWPSHKLVDKIPTAKSLKNKEVYISEFKCGSVLLVALHVGGLSP